MQTLDLGLTLQDAGLSQNESTVFLASLLQDLPKSQIQLALIEQNLSTTADSTTLKNVKLLSNILNTIYRMQENHYPQTKLSYFGTSLLNLKLYHFFVAAALSQKLRAQDVTPRTAAFLAFLFNYIYESSNESKLRAFFNEPPQIHEYENQDDVLSGYLGAYQGVTTTSPERLQQLRAAIVSSPLTLLLEIVN